MSSEPVKRATEVGIVILEISVVRFADLEDHSCALPSDKSLGYFRSSASRTT